MGRHHRAPGRSARRGPTTIGFLASVVCSLALAAGITTVASAHPGHVPGTPCTASARACVDLDGHEAWLIGDGGEIVHGPVPVTDGAEGHETPRGTFRVEWKHAEHISGESGAPMPFSVFFAPGGIAFHEGNLGTASAGCVRMERADAARFYEFLQVGDEVQVV